MGLILRYFTEFGCFRGALRKSGRSCSKKSSWSLSHLVSSLFFVGGTGSRLTQCGLGRGLSPYQVASWPASSHLATITMDRKVGAAVPLFGGAGSPSNNVVWAESIFVPSGILIHLAVWPQQTWAENWELCPFWGGAGSPSNTRPGPSPTSTPNGILIHQPFGQNTPTSQTGQTTVR